MEFLRDCAAYVFDMDGLLLDTERLARDAVNASGKDLGLSLPDDIFLEMIGRRGADIRDRLILRLNGDAALADRLIAGSDLHYQASLARGVPVKEGVKELLDWFAAQKLPCAVATSTRTARAEHKLEAAGLRKYFRSIVGGDQVGQGKPAPDIYLRATAQLQVDAALCGVFEDSEPGLRSAHAAGARVVWVPDLAPVSAEAQGLARAKVESLTAVLAGLKMYSG